MCHKLALYCRRTSSARFVCSLLLAIPLLLGAAQNLSEYDVKAAFLFNFTHFVEWPQDSFSDPSSPIVIGILGPNPFGNTLAEVVKGEKVNGRSIVVQYYNKVEEGLISHVLYLSPNYANIAAALLALERKPTLTVSDAPGFAESGGAIGFFTVQNRIRLKVNLNTAKESRLTISSKLLKVAETIEQ